MLFNLLPYYSFLMNTIFVQCLKLCCNSRECRNESMTNHLSDNSRHSTFSALSCMQTTTIILGEASTLWPTAETRTCPTLPSPYQSRTRWRSRQCRSGPWAGAPSRGADPASWTEAGTCGRSKGQVLQLGALDSNSLTLRAFSIAPTDP
jgi:hypothetical protein